MTMWLLFDAGTEASQQRRAGSQGSKCGSSSWRHLQRCCQENHVCTLPWPGVISCTPRPLDDSERDKEINWLIGWLVWMISRRDANHVWMFISVVKGLYSKSRDISVICVFDEYKCVLGYGGKSSSATWPLCCSNCEWLAQEQTFEVCAVWECVHVLCKDVKTSGELVLLNVFDASISKMTSYQKNLLEDVASCPSCALEHALIFSKVVKMCTWLLGVDSRHMVDDLQGKSMFTMSCRLSSKTPH